VRSAPGKGEVSAQRATHRNGYRSRAWETRVGEIELAILKKRSGDTYFPSFLEPRKDPSRRSSVSPWGPMSTQKKNAAAPTKWGGRSFAYVLIAS
jgi:Transposase, Mutator family